MTPFTDHRPTEDALRRFAFAGRRGKTIRVAFVVALALFVLAAGGAMIAPWLFSADALSRSVYGQLQSSSGLYVMARGPVRLMLTPRPHIVVKDVAFADLKGVLVIETPELNCALDLGRLLAGRVQVTSLTLLHPRAIIDADGGDIVAPGAAMRASLTRPETQEAKEADAARLGVVNIVDGALTIKRRSGNQIIERIRVSLDWPRIGQPALIAGGVDWRGERHDALVWIARPGLLLRDEQSFVATRVDGKNLNFEAQGFLSLSESPHFSGHIAGRAAAAREVLDLIDIHPRLPGALRDTELSAEAELDSNEARLRNLHVRVDGNVLDGDAKLLKRSGKLELSAKLNSSFLSLEPVLADLPAMATLDGQWSREPLDLTDLKAIDFNLHLDAGHARLGRLIVDHGALSLRAHDGVLDVALEEAKAYGGRMMAEARIRPDDEGAISAHGVARTEKVDAGPLIWDIFGHHSLGGGLDADLILDAQGADFDALMHSLAGQVNFALSDADIEGVDFSRALNLLQTNPLASAQAARSGRSRLRTASTKINFAHGLGNASGAGQGEGYFLSLSGYVNAPERKLSLKTIAMETQSASVAQDDQLPRIVFDLTGEWDDPNWRPDPQSFSLRSGAAATLLQQGGSAAPPSP